MLGDRSEVLGRVDSVISSEDAGNLIYSRGTISLDTNAALGKSEKSCAIVASPVPGHPSFRLLRFYVDDRTSAERNLVRQRNVDFLSSRVAHEINNPLTWVLFTVDELSAELASGAPNVQDMRMLLNDAKTGVQRVTHIIRDVRQLAHTANETQVQGDVAEAIGLAMRIGRHTLPRGIQVTTEVAPGLPPIGMSTSALGQVILNLLVNAGDALDESGRRDGQVDVVVFYREGRVTVRVSDNGPGVPRALVARIFDAHFTTKAPGKGTGLGLPMVRDLVSKAGGTVALESSDRGAVFTLTLPSIVAPSVAAPEGNRPLLLAIDDDEAILRVWQAMLNPHFDVVTARNGSEATQQVQSGLRPDLVLCDVHLPDTCGPDLVRELAEVSREFHPRTVFVTASLTEALQQQVSSLGHRILSKNDKLTDFFDAVDCSSSTSIRASGSTLTR